MKLHKKNSIITFTLTDTCTNTLREGGKEAEKEGEQTDRHACTRARNTHTQTAGVKVLFLS